MNSGSIYELDGRVPLVKAIPFGMQHVLAMFVANITPIIILCNFVGIDSGLSATLVQNSMIIAFPALGVILTTIPQAVLGGCTIMMFGSIMFAGINMISKCGFGHRNLIIVALSLSVGIGFTQASGLFTIFPKIIQTVFAENCVAVVFILAVILNLILPKEQND